MRLTKAGLTLVVALAAAVASASVPAHERGWGGHRVHGSGHVRFGVFVGAPLFYPPYYPGYYPGPYYYYSPPAVVAVPASPPVYVEQNAAAPEQGNYWYYCADAKAYYPYVQQCPGGWQRVAPQPPPQ